MKAVPVSKGFSIRGWKGCKPMLSVPGFTNVFSEYVVYDEIKLKLIVKLTEVYHGRERSRSV
ncbi:hypothetical protein INR49_025297 [Caranx melampygus]|nr:hypothetical protein INR49_025297 [Caranx melampygus]